MMKRRIQYILLFLLLTTAIQAQRGYEYWLDDNYDSRITGTQSTDNDFALSVDVGTLSPGLHIFNYHAQDVTGSWGTLHRQAFLIDATGSSYEYWIDEDYSHRGTGGLSGPEVSTSVDISHLSPGIHMFNYRTLATGGSGALTRHAFLIGTDISGYEYWYDDNYAKRKVKAGNGGSVALSFDLNEVPAGIHALNIRPRTSDGTVGPATSMLFVNELAVVAYEYWFDDDIANKVTANASGNNLQLPISVSHLSGDVHYLNFRAMHADGSWGTLMRKGFVLKSNIIGYDYAFGSDSTKHVNVTSSEQLVMQSQKFAIPDPKERTTICDTTTIQIDTVANTAMAIRRDTTDFSIFFRNDEGRVSEVQSSEVAVADTLLRQLPEIPLFGSISVERFDSSDFRGFYINVPDSDTYVIAATQECRLFLYNGQAQRIEDIPLSTELLTLKTGRYYGIIYDMKGTNDSIVVSYALDNNVVAKPVITHEGNRIAISTTTAQTTIYYTMDGTMPDATSTVYTDTITVSRNCTIKAIAMRQNYENSEIDSLVVNWFKCEKPVVAWNGDQLTATTATDGAIIEYSLTQSGVEAPFDQGGEVSPLKITVTQDVTINLYAVKTGWANSDTLVVDYPYTAWQELLAAVTDANAAIQQTTGNDNVPQQMLNELESVKDTALMMYSYRTAEKVVINEKTAQIRELTDAVLRLANAQNEAYAVLTGVTISGMTLTFYYDKKKEERNGMSVGPFTEWTERGWNDVRTSITTVAFDASFTNDTTITSTAYWFNGMTNLTAIDGLQYLNTQNVTNMSSMFCFCSSLTNLDVSGFNTAKVTDMSNMFLGCGSLTSLDVSGFKTANVTNMRGVFSGCRALTGLDVSGFNTANVTEMDDMFCGCSSLTSLDVRKFNTDKVISMYGMFDSCSSLESLDLSHFNTEKVTNMNVMFRSCSSLTSLDLSYFKTDSVTQMALMFCDCSGLLSLDVSHFNTEKVTNMNAMFNGCSSLTSLDLSSFNTSKVIYDNNNNYGIVLMFSYCTKLTTIFVSDGWTIANLTESADVFKNCINLVGGMGTVYDANHTDYTYAHIDGGPSNPGYFTPKGGYGMASKPTFTHEGNLVFVNSATEGATIRYTIDDVAPTDTTGIVYSDSIRVTRNCTIRAIATRENFTPSEVAEYNVDWFKCEMPEMAWNGDQMIATTVTEGAVVEYSLTQSGVETPFDQGGEVSPLKITVTQDATINLYAVKAGWANSDTLVVDYPYTAWQDLLSAVGYARQTIEAANQSDKVVKVGDCPYAALNAKLTDAEGWYAERNSEAADINDLRNQILQLIAEVEAELNAVDYVYDADNGVLAINGGTTMAEALDAAGGRDEVAKTITAIVWNSTATLTNSDLQGLDNPNMLVYVQSASQAPANRDNVVIGNDSTGYMAKNIKLTDVTEGNGDFYCPIAFTAEMISYTHEYRQQTEVGVSRGWETIAMPFTVQTIMHEKNGLITPFGSDSINRHFWLRQLTQQGLAQTRQIEANTPYLISMPNSAAYSAGFNLNGLVTFSSQNVEVPVTQLNVVEAQTGAGDMVLLQPNFKGQSATAMIYALNVGVERDGHPEGSVFEANYRSVRPFEAFTVHHGNGPAPQFISISDINGGTTGIEDVRCKMSDGRGDNWYDLNGRKLQQKPTQKGVYLNNGRKVVVVH